MERREIRMAVEAIRRRTIEEVMEVVWMMKEEESKREIVSHH